MTTETAITDPADITAADVAGVWAFLYPRLEEAKDETASRYPQRNDHPACVAAASLAAATHEMLNEALEAAVLVRVNKLASAAELDEADRTVTRAWNMLVEAASSWFDGNDRHAEWLPRWAMIWPAGEAS
ncbi:hypothetical protein AB0A05_27320 [Streptomyces sp. NPDC046374]|uniref:hypothetical protein n=1 Tax=Streptomyces sp. NPDC046374 TaxID=3154917 RepID=UPI0033E0D469